MKYSLKQIKVIIVFMSINTFALFVNYFGYGIKIYNSISRIDFLFTNSAGVNHDGDGRICNFNGYGGYIISQPFEKIKNYFTRL